MAYGLFAIFFFLLIFRVPIAVALGLAVLSAFWIFGPEPFALSGLDRTGSGRLVARHY